MSEFPQELIVTLGLPGAGKSTWTVEQVRSQPPGTVTRLNRDSLRAMLHDGRFVDPVTAGLDAVETERQVTAVQRAAVFMLFEHGARRVIVDDTNMRVATLNRWYALALDLNVMFGVKSFLDVPLETCVARDLTRAMTGGDSVGESVIRDMWEHFGHEVGVWYELVIAGHVPPDFQVYEKKISEIKLRRQGS